MKKAITLILAIALCASLFACGGGTDTPKATDEQQSAATEAPNVTKDATKETADAEATVAPSAEASTEAPEATQDATDAPNATAAPATKAPASSDSIYDALLSEEGYTVDLEEMVFPEDDTYEVIAIKDIADADAKKAFLDAGHKETDLVLHLGDTANDSGTNFCGNWETVLSTEYDDEYEDFYASGNEYNITIESYATYSGGYLIELDNTSSNHVLLGPGVIANGYKKSTTNCKVNGNGYKLTFYVVPVDTYIATINFKQIVHEKKFSYSIDEITAKEISASQMLNYTYDFSEKNIPDLGNNGDYIKIADADAALKANLSAANGFKDYAFHSSNGQFGFYFTNGNFTQGKTYTVKLRVYSETDLTTYEPNVADYFAHLLPLNELYDYSTSGHQLTNDNGYQDQVNFTATAVSGKPGVYDVTGSITCTDDTVLYSIMMYNNKAPKNIYIASITITAN